MDVCSHQSLQVVDILLNLVLEPTVLKHNRNLFQNVSEFFTKRPEGGSETIYSKIRHDP